MNSLNPDTLKSIYSFLDIEDLLKQDPPYLDNDYKLKLILDWCDSYDIQYKHNKDYYVSKIKYLLLGFIKQYNVRSIPVILAKYLDLSRKETCKKCGGKCYSLKIRESFLPLCIDCYYEKYQM